MIEQILIERFGEPLLAEELNASAKEENWANHKTPEKTIAKKKGGPKPKFWGKKHPKKVKQNPV